MPQDRYTVDALSVDVDSTVVILEKGIAVKTYAQKCELVSRANRTEAAESRLKEAMELLRRWLTESEQHEPNCLCDMCEATRALLAKEAN